MPKKAGNAVEFCVARFVYSRLKKNLLFHLLKHLLVYFHSVFLVELLVPNPLKIVLIVGNNKSAHISHFLRLCNQASAKHEIVFVFILVGSNNPVGAKHLRVDLGILAFCDKHTCHLQILAKLLAQHRDHTVGGNLGNTLLGERGD